jgi:RNA polymerase sigma factor (sigma-70 family)
MAMRPSQASRRSPRPPSDGSLRAAVRHALGKELLQNPPLSDDQMAALVARMREGDKHARNKAAWTVANHNARLLARKLPDLSIPLGLVSDAVQEALLALHRAALSYDPRRGRFSTYAWPHVKTAVLKFVNRAAVPLTAPAGILSEARRALNAGGHRRRRRIPPGSALERAIAALGSVPLSSPCDDGDGELADQIADPSAEDPCEVVVQRLHTARINERLLSLVDGLPRRERQAVLCCLGRPHTTLMSPYEEVTHGPSQPPEAEDPRLGRTVAQVAACLRVSQDYARALLESALARLRSGPAMMYLREVMDEDA